MLKKILILGGMMVGSGVFVHVLLVDNNNHNFKNGKLKDQCPVMEYIRCMKRD